MTDLVLLRLVHGRYNANVSLKRTDALEKALHLFCQKYMLDEDHALLWIPGRFLNKYESPATYNLTNMEIVHVIFDNSGANEEVKEEDSEHTTRVIVEIIEHDSEE